MSKYFKLVPKQDIIVTFLSKHSNQVITRETKRGGHRYIHSQHELTDC